MCGIAGMLRLDGTPLDDQARQTVSVMTDALVHRGPDGSGVWLDGPVCLGHRRLAIIDQEGGAQPMETADHAYCVTYNGEMYTFRELRKLLIEKGSRFRTSSDTEVILEAYRVFGEECVRLFEGMFALALWDKKKKTLFLARDRFGKKPLFYTLQSGFCYFASELSALLTVPGLSLTLDPAAVIRYLAYDYVPCPDTMYREVKTLPPSHTLLLGQELVAAKRYWDLPAPEENGTWSMDEKEAEEELVRLLRQAVRRRLVSDVPLGVFLSGGLDSSIVTACMAMESDRPVETFSIGFAEASYDESRYARIIADRFATNHHEEILEASLCADLLPDIVSAMDVPMADASVAPTYLLSRLTRRFVTVALGGDGSDELWAGYENYAAYAIALFYRSWPSFLRTGIIEPLSRFLPGSQGYVNLHLAMQTFLAGARAPNWLRIQTLLTSLAPALQTDLLTPDFKKSATGLFKEEVLFSSTKLEYESWNTSASPLARTFHVYCRQFLPEDILVKVDRCSMLHSLEVRAPFLDTDLASFTARLPLDEKFMRLKGKKLLRKAVKDILPKSILTRNKRGFQIPVAEWLRGRLRPLCEDCLAEKRLSAQGIFAPQAVRKLMDEHFSGRADRRKALWTLLVFQLWWDACKRRNVV